MSNFPTLFPYTTVFDEIFGEAVERTLKSDTTGYPRYNVWEDDDGNRLFVSLAVTGIPREKIEVYLNVIEANVDKDTRKYQVKNYPIKSFKRVFGFDRKYEVQNVIHENGELIVELVRKTPKKRQIPILPGDALDEAA